MLYSRARKPLLCFHRINKMVHCLLYSKICCLWFSNKRQPLVKHCRCRRKEFLCQSIEIVSEHFLKIKMKGTKPNLGIHILEGGMKEGIIDDVNESDNSYKLQCDYQQIPLLFFFFLVTRPLVRQRKNSSLY